MNKILLTIFATFILSISAFAQPGDILSPTAKAAFDKENYEPCIAELSKIIVREPKNSNAFFERARCYFFGADSKADYERLEKIYLLRLDADKSKALDSVTGKFMDLRNKAKADVEQSIILNPKYAAAYNLRGYMKSLSNKNDEAIADYSKAIEIDPKFIKPYYNRGNSKYDKKDYDGAIADFTKIIEFEPNNIAALTQRSYAFSAKNNLKLSREAISDLLKLAKLEPKNKKHYEIIEYLVLNADKPYTYADIFKDFIAINPNSPEGYLGLARLQASVERYYDLDIKKVAEYWNTSADAYLKYIELKPDVIEPYIELFNFYFDKARSPVNAKVLAVRTLAKFPNDARSYILNGRMAESNNDWATAVKEFSRAIELNPNLSLAYERRSNAYAGLKEEDKAFADLNKAIELNPSNGSAYLDRGNFQNRLKKYSEAIADFNEADKLKVTCAKTYRGILYSTMANTNKEAPNTGNFLNAQREFLADDAQKCYLTHYMYGISLYAQGFDSQAAQRFDYALTVYKKYGYTTEKIIEFQNLLKTKPASTTSQGTQPNSGIDEVIAFYKSESIKNGGQLLGSGIYDYSVAFDPKMNFKVERGKAYVFIAIKEYDPTFGMDIISNGRNILRPTNSWDDRSYKIDSNAQYGMKYLLTKFGNYSVFIMNLTLTQNASIWDVQFSQSGKVKDYHWMFFKSQ